MHAPWGFRVAAREVATFHLVTSGECRLSVEGIPESIALVKGDFVVLPHGKSHVMSDHPKSRVTMLETLVKQNPPDTNGSFRLNGKGALTTLVCGGLQLEYY